MCEECGGEIKVLVPANIGVCQSLYYICQKCKLMKPWYCPNCGEGRMGTINTILRPDSDYYKYGECALCGHEEKVTK